jgi:hypothetical protein
MRDRQDLYEGASIEPGRLVVAHEPLGAIGADDDELGVTWTTGRQICAPATLAAIRYGIARMTYKVCRFLEHALTVNPCHAAVAPQRSRSCPTIWRAYD